MMMTADESAEVVGPHSGAIRAWHDEGYKRRDALRADWPDQWADQDQPTRGRWVNNLIVAAARDDETGLRRIVPLNGFNAVEVRHGDRPAAHLRFRRIEFERNLYGDEYPVIPGPLSDTAKEWFGNAHLCADRLPQLAFELDGDIDAPNDLQPRARSHSNLLVGHTANPTTNELGRIVVVCFSAADHIYWWRPLEGPEAGFGTTSPAARRNALALPSAAPVRITPKGRAQ